MNTRTITLAVCLFIFAISSGLQAQMETAEVYKYCNSTVVEDILDEKDIDYEEVKKDLYKVQLKGYSVSLLIDDGDIILRTYFSDIKPSLRDINDFNASYRWGRVYYDDDMDITYGAELSFTGGIAEQGIHIFLNTYGAILETLVEKIGDDK